jgi:hypothetical protein
MNANERNTSGLSDAEMLLEEAETLIWALLDDTLQEGEAERLTSLLETNATVRSRYIDCVQLHVDLQQHYGRPAAQLNPEKRASGAVMPNLGIGVPAVPTYVPTTD